MAGSNQPWVTTDLAFGTTYCPELQIMNNEAMDFIKPILRGVEVTDETLAFEDVKEVGPKGDFMTRKSTLDHFKETAFLPALMDRTTVRAWEKKPILMIDKAKEKRKEIEETHKIPPLPKDVRERLHAIQDDADVKLRKWPAAVKER